MLHSSLCRRGLRERCLSGALRGGPGRGTNVLNASRPRLRSPPRFPRLRTSSFCRSSVQVVSAEQSFHRRLAEYEMRLDLFRKFSRDFRREFLHDFFCFRKSRTLGFASKRLGGCQCWTKEHRAAETVSRGQLESSFWMAKKKIIKKDGKGIGVRQTFTNYTM